MSHKTGFVTGGGLFDCQGCGERCNLCKYKRRAETVIEDAKKNIGKNAANIDMKEIGERQKEINKNDELYKKKFGILKKASVLLFYERANDAFDEIAKAANIIKDQREDVKENELNIQKRWQFKLNLPDGLELPKPFEKVRPEDVTDKFLKQIDGGNCDTATLKLYVSKVCPLVRSAYDKNTFLNGLIEDLYFKCEDIMVDK